MLSTIVIYNSSFSDAFYNCSLHLKLMKLLQL